MTYTLHGECRLVMANSFLLADIAYLPLQRPQFTDTSKTAWFLLVFYWTMELHYIHDPVEEIK